MPRAAALVAVAAAAAVLLLLLPAPAVATTLEPRVDRRLVLTPGHMCGTQGKYARGSAFEANLWSLATTVAAEVSASTCNCSAGTVVGRRPDQVTASAYCHWRPDARSPDCGACVALAFREARRLCPYHMQAVAVVDGGACSVSFHEVQRGRRRAEDARRIHDYSSIFHYGYTSRWINPRVRALSWWINPDILVVLLFQAAGLACVAFLFLQEGRTRGRDPASHGAIDSSEYLSVPGDQ